MNLREYLINKTDEFEPEVSGKGRIYYKYFHRECNTAFAVLGSAGIMYPSILLTLAGIIAVDTTIRAIRGDHGRKAVSGLIGVIREFNDKSITKINGE